MTRNQSITIIGAGLAGIAMALVLAKKGYAVSLFDENSESEMTLSQKQKSYNLVLYKRGIEAIKRIGVTEQELKQSVMLVDSYVTHLKDNSVIFTKLRQQKGEYSYQITRQKLLSLLLEKTKKFSNITFYFNYTCIGIEKSDNIAYFRKNKKIYAHPYSLLIGADGINSVVRKYIQENVDTQHTQEFFEWGYKEIYATASEVEKLNFRSTATHRWPREHSLLFGFPNSDNSLSMMFTLPIEGPVSFKTLNSRKAITTFVTTNWPDLVPIIDIIVASIQHNPLGLYSSIKTYPWYYNDSIILIGDAAHGLLPFYGQGLNSAFEDSIIFSKLISKYKGNWQQILTAFQKLRKEDTDSMADLAKKNFFVLRDGSRSFSYIIKDKCETALNMLFPTIFVPPLYKIIIYSNEPYKSAVKKYMKQQKVLKYAGFEIGYIVLAGLFVMYKQFDNVMMFLLQNIRKNITNFIPIIFEQSATITD